VTRTDNSIRNIKFGTLGLFLSYVVNFVSRRFFVMYLSAEHLGVNGLFTNILTVLSLMELGVGTAIGYSLYRPLALQETKKIQLIMQFYRKAYWIIGLSVIATGFAITPLLPFLITEETIIPHLYPIYWLFVVNSGVSYFLSYKRTLVIADQKRYINTNYQYGFQVLKCLIQIGILITTQSFILYLLVMLITTVVENVLISMKITDLYPYLRERQKEKLGTEEERQIKKNIFALTFHRIGAVIVNGTDNILMVMFVNLASAGIYSNYTMVTKALNSVLAIFYQSLTASVGNFVVEKENPASIPLFDQLNAATFWLFGFCSICLYILFNPFIEIWLGPAYQFSHSAVLIIVINFYIVGMLRPVRTFYASMGLFWFDRYKPIFESSINLVFSIILVKRFGLIGILAGTTISSLTTIFWFEPYILYRHGFGQCVSGYFIQYVRMTALTVIVGLLTYLLIGFVTLTNMYLEFLKNMLICATIPNVLFFLIYRSLKEGRDMRLLVKRVLVKRRRIRK